MNSPIPPTNNSLTVLVDLANEMYQYADNLGYAAGPLKQQAKRILELIEHTMTLREDKPILDIFALSIIPKLEQLAKAIGYHKQFGIQRFKTNHLWKSKSTQVQPNSIPRQEMPQQSVSTNEDIDIEAVVTKLYQILDHDD